jgi:hypothetical protein
VNIRPCDLRLSKYIGFKVSDATTLYIDNHVDTCVVDKYSLLIYEYERQAVYHTSLQHLTPGELQLKKWLKYMSDFDINVTQKHGNPAIEADFDQSTLTPVHSVYGANVIYDGKGTADVDSSEQVCDARPEEITPTPEIDDNYLGGSQWPASM